MASNYIGHVTDTLGRVVSAFSKTSGAEQQIVDFTALQEAYMGLHPIYTAAIKQ